MGRIQQLLAAVAGLLLVCPGCSKDDPADDDDTTAAGDDDAGADDDDDSGSADDDDDALSEDVATPDGGMPVGTSGVQVGLRAQAENDGEILVSAPVEVTLTDPVEELPSPAVVGGEPPDASAIHGIGDTLLQEVSP